MRRSAAICLASVATLVAAFSFLDVQSAQPNRPNIVVIVSDDMGYADIGVHGSRDIPTPHIDALAKNGTRFTDATSPARTAVRREPDS